MDTELLKTFLEINRTRHFGRAADNLFVTQSTVSARIRQLEEEVGAALFIRARNDIQLTAAGQRLLKYAENILTTWNRARQEIAIDDEDRIPLTVAGLPSLWDIILQEWLHTACEINPDLMIHAEVLVPDVITRRLLDSTLDIGFMFEAPQVSVLQTTEITTIPLVMVSSDRHCTIEQAFRENYIMVDWGTSFATAHARHFPDMPTPALRMGLGRMARDYLLARGGSAYLAEPMIREHLRKNELFLVNDAPVIKRTASAVYSLQSEKQALISQVLGYFNGITS
jgi:DNA-binding transcriptional LysR family regulator